MANKGIGVNECPKHGEYFLDAPDSPCPSCKDEPPTKRYRLFDVVWDTDGHNVTLPYETIVEIDDDDDIRDIGADLLSDKHGWCVWSFDYEEIS